MLTLFAIAECIFWATYWLVWQECITQCLLFSFKGMCELLIFFAANKLQYDLKVARGPAVCADFVSLHCPCSLLFPPLFPWNWVFGSSVGTMEQSPAEPLEGVSWSPLLLLNLVDAFTSVLIQAVFSARLSRQRCILRRSYACATGVFEATLRSNHLQNLNW